MKLDELLNEEAFQEFCSLDLGDGSVLRELLQVYESSGNERLVRLKAALSEGNYERLRKEAHSLKSAVAHVGGLQLAQLIHTFELQARAESPLESLRAALEIIQRDYLALNFILHERLGKGSVDA